MPHSKSAWFRVGLFFLGRFFGFNLLFCCFDFAGKGLFCLLGGIDKFLIGHGLPGFERVVPCVGIDDFAGPEDFGKKVKRDIIVQGAFHRLVGVEGLVAGLFDADTVVAIPFEGDGNRGVANFFVIEPDTGIGRVGDDGDFAFDAAGGGENSRKAGEFYQYIESHSQSYPILRLPKDITPP